MLPMKFKPIYKEKIWGGRSMEKCLDKDLPAGMIGESWELSDNGDDISIVSHGPLAGKSLADLLSAQRTEILGPRLAGIYKGRFPLLFKFIDANDRLSIQVHPDDRYAAEHENGSLGKTECWYICKARPGARIIAGFRRKVTLDEFKGALEKHNIEGYFRKIRVKRGQMYHIPAGRVHAIMSGIVINEIQQNSDITYRVFDWNRTDTAGKPRDLHIRQSLETADFKDTRARMEPPVRTGRGIRRRVKDRYFVVEEISAAAYTGLSTLKDDSFHVLTVLEGNGRIKAGDEEIVIRRGETILVPHACGEYGMRPERRVRLLKTHIP